MKWLAVICVLAAVPAWGQQNKDARPLATLLDEGAKVVAASGEMVWVQVERQTYMCIVQMNARFRQGLRYGNVRELYANWPSALCFNAGSFE